MNAVTTHPAGESVFLPAPIVPTVRWLVASAVALIVATAFAVALWGTQDLVNWGGWTLTWRFIRAAVSPAMDLAILQLAATSTLTTIAYALCGSALSLVLGAVGGVAASEAWWEIVGARFGGKRAYFSWLGKLVRVALSVPRGIHELIWGLLFVNVLGLDPLVAVLAIGIPFGAITAKVFAETIDETPRRAALCLRASGAGAASAFAYGVLSKSLPFLLSYALYRLECAIRSAAVLGLIGAGGLGYQIMLSLQSLRYEQVWTFLYALMLLVALTDWGNSRITLALRSRSATSAEELVKQTRQVTIAALVVALGVVASYVYLSLDVGRLFEAPRLARLQSVFATSLPPRIEQGDLSKLATLSAQTLVMSIVAIAMAAVPAVLVSWFSSMSLFDITKGCEKCSRRPRNFVARTLTAATRMGLIAIRGLSDGIWVLLALFIFFPGTFAGAVALALYNFGVIGRILSQANESADKKTFGILRAQGASFGSAILYGLLPLMLPKYLAYILYRWEVCLRATVVVGVAGAGGLGRRLEEQLASFDYRGVAATLLFFIALTMVVDAVSSSSRRALRQA
ncbi:MAG: PhnE/PtxC family ABC transporter permease [Myxococcota bacterium]